MLRRIWYSKKYKVNFLGIPKCGVTTVCKSLEIDIDRDYDPSSNIFHDVGDDHSRMPTA